MAIVPALSARFEYRIGRKFPYRRVPNFPVKILMWNNFLSATDEREQMTSFYRVRGMEVPNQGKTFGRSTFRIFNSDFSVKPSYALDPCTFVSVFLLRIKTILFLFVISFSKCIEFAKSLTNKINKLSCFSSSCLAVFTSPPGPVVLRRQKKEVVPQSVFTIPPELDVSLLLEFVG